MSDNVQNPAPLSPFTAVFRDNADGTALRERALPIAVNGAISPMTPDQIKAIPTGWLTIAGPDGAIVGACHPRVIYSRAKAEAITREAFQIKLTPEQELAAFEAEAAEIQRKQAEALAAKRAAIVAQVKLRQYESMGPGPDRDAFGEAHAADLLIAIKARDFAPK